MSSHHRTAGTDFQIVELGGKSYTLRPLTVGIYASMESYIVSTRPDPLAVASEAVKRLPANQHDAVWKAAMATVSSQQIAEFESSVDGLAWKLWQCLKADHPEIDSSRQQMQLFRVTDRIGELVLEFFRSIEVGATFHAENLRAYVDGREVVGKGASSC